MIRTAELTPTVGSKIISSIIVGSDSVEYVFTDHGCANESEVYPYEEEAEARLAAEEMLEKKKAEEAKRLMLKDKSTESWVWHVKYHRSAIRDAERGLAYHRAKLAVAQRKAEEGEMK